MKPESIRRKKQKALYYLKNKERIKACNDKYVRENKEKVQERQRKWRERRRLARITPKIALGTYNSGIAETRYGGLREFVIQRDGEKCIDCGLTRQEHWKLYGKDLTVNHINGLGRNTKNPDNRPENLETLCLRCHGKKDGIRRWRNGK